LIVQLHRRAECMDPAFQLFIMDLLSKVSKQGGDTADIQHSATEKASSKMQSRSMSFTSSDLVFPVAKPATSPHPVHPTGFLAMGSGYSDGVMRSISSSFGASLSALGQPATEAMSPAVFMACFKSGDAEIEFHPAPVKSIARMYEKLAEYDAEGASWPRCAAILDPVSSMHCHVL